MPGSPEWYEAKRVFDSSPGLSMVTRSEAAPLQDAADKEREQPVRPRGIGAAPQVPDASAGSSRPLSASRRELLGGAPDKRDTETGSGGKAPRGNKRGSSDRSPGATAPEPNQSLQRRVIGGV